MNRRIQISSCILVSVLALAACAQKGNGSTTGGQGGIAALSSPSSASGPGSGDSANNSGQDNGSGTDSGSGSGSGNGSGNGSGSGSGNGSGSGSGGHSSPSPSTNPSGPRIVSLSADGAVCPSHPQGVPYGTDGSVTVSWKIANADTVDLYMDGGLYDSYPGQQGSQKLNFSCPETAPRQKITHQYMIVIKNTSVKKTVSASAYSNPS